MDQMIGAVGHTLKYLLNVTTNYEFPNEQNFQCGHKLASTTWKKWHDDCDDDVMISSIN